MLHSNFETFGLDKVTMTEQIKDVTSNTSISNPLFSIVSCSSTRTVCRPIFRAYLVHKFLYLAFSTTDYFGALFLRSVTSSGVG